MELQNIQPLYFQDFADRLPVSKPAGKTKPAKSFAPAGRKPLPSAEIEIPPPPPVYGEDDLKTAERDGYRKGYLEGEAEGRRQMESEQADVNQKLAEVVEGFTRSLAPLLADYRRVAAAMQKDAVDLALAIARKAAGEAMDANAAASVEQGVLRACEAMIHEPKISITVHESLADALTAQIEELISRYPTAGDLVILRDPELPLTDWRIEWHNGAMESKNEKLWQDMDKAVTGIGIAAARELEEEIDALEGHMLAKENKESGDEPIEAP